jgi:RimJ/RimL family protein N-acetyltransferase
LLKGKNVNLRLLEKEDLPTFIELWNDPEFSGNYRPLIQVSKKDMEDRLETRPPESRMFFIEKKDKTIIGIINHFPVGELLEIGFVLIPSERGKGYCTEAVKTMVDYLFLSKDIVRIQAKTDSRNVASQRVLEKTGFRKEGVMRKSLFSRGSWRDMILYSIVREEWKESRIPSALVRWESEEVYDS